MTQQDPTQFDVAFGEGGGVELKATVFPAPPSAKSADGACPTLLFFHSGGLTGGSRLGLFPYWLSNLASSQGCHFVTFDYRLFPTATVRELESDLIQGYTYTTTSLSTELQKRGFQRVDPKRIVVCGASAGVYCAAMLTLHLVEAGTPPSAFLGLYGQVNIGGEFYNIPKPDDVLLGLSPRRPMDELQHLFGAGRTPVVGTDVEFFRTRVEDIKPEDRLLYDQTNLCSNLFYNGVAADAFTGSTGLSKALGALPGITHDLEAQRRTIPQEKHHFFPLLRLTPSFPPTLIFHGEKDIAIPISDSEVFYGELERNRVDSRFVRVVGEGSGHGFDRQNFEHWYEAYLRDNTLWLLSKV